MKNLEFTLFTIALSCSFLYSCKKDDSNTNQGEKIFVVNATSQTKWVYFSFENIDTIKITNPANSNNWDLAFRRNNIKTNSGLSGNGMGGTFNSGKTSSTGFDLLTIVPDSAMFAVDDSLFVPGAYGIIDTILANPPLSNWYNYDQTTNVLSSKNYIYILKTATGKYVKMQILSYYNDTDPSLITGSGYMKFKYLYQQDGSKKLQ